VKFPLNPHGAFPNLGIGYIPVIPEQLITPMAQTYSFDVTTGVDLQEVDNAVNQAQKEVAQRYDFKGSTAAVEYKRAEEMLVLTAEDDFRMNALFDILQSKLIKRNVPVKNLDIGDTKEASGGSARKEIKLKTALDKETAKKVAQAIKDAKLKKVQASIQEDQVRVTAPDKDELQGAIALLRKGDFGVELKFGNYR
jgi:uncharacterized protein YajQ (UPF0234 family)